MIAAVTRLPTAATSYYTVVKDGPRWWAVQIVTPTSFKALRTKLETFSDRESALAQGRLMAAKMQRPFREPKFRS